MNRRKAIRNTGLFVGAGILAPSFLALFQSCNSQSRLDWQPIFLDADESKFISALVDTILPRTDTPGALDVKADMFIDKVFAMLYDENAQQKIKSDISQFNAECTQNYGDNFTALDSRNRAKVLQAAETTSPKYNGSIWGTAVGNQEPVGFYRSMKSMALWAYLSSEEVGENVLNYDPIPMVYDGCVPLADIGNKWSL